LKIDARKGGDDYNYTTLCCFQSKGSLSRTTPPVRSTACKQVDWRLYVTDEVLMQPRSEECFMKIIKDPCLGFCLPPKKALPGTILKHVYKFVDDLLKLKSPCIFKVGFSHDPERRFRNSKYGYINDNFHQWESMEVLYAGADSTSASFIEAAAIQKFKGDLAMDGTLKQ